MSVRLGKMQGVALAPPKEVTEGERRAIKALIATFARAGAALDRGRGPEATQLLTPALRWGI